MQVILSYVSSFCLACEAEARHMYCFSGGGGVVKRDICTAFPAAAAS